MIRYFFINFIIFLLFCLPFHTALAKIDGCEKVWSIENIIIDEISEDVVISRKKGFEQATENAFKILLERIITTPYGEEDEIVPIIANEQIESFIDFKFIKSETVLTNRFIAEVSFCFLSEKIINFLLKNNLSWSELTSTPILIFPVWKTMFSSRLWKDPNPWREAFRESLKHHNGLSLQILPEGRIGVERSIDSKLAISENKNAISGAIKRGQARRAVIAIAKINNKPGYNSELQINAFLYNSNGNFQGSIYGNVFEFNPETLKEILLVSSKNIIESMERRWKQANIFDNKLEKNIMVFLKSSSFKNWSKGIQILEKLPGVKEVRTKLLNLEGGFLDITFLGDENQLISIMSEKKLPISGSRQNIIINSEEF